MTAVSKHEDIMADLLEAIDQIPDAPDLEWQGPADVAAMGAALGVAQGMLSEAATRWNTNARIALPDWEDHAIQNARRPRKQSATTPATTTKESP